MPGLLRIFSLSYEERARRAWVLIDDNVVGNDDLEPKLSEESFEILFDGMIATMDLEVARSVGGPIEWDFSDADPWYLVVTNGHAEAKPGKAGEAALRLECSSADWAKISAGLVDLRWALLKRHLKGHGHLTAKAKLPRLFT